MLTCRGAVREAVSSCLSGLLSAGSEAERRTTEQEMKALEVTEGMPWYSPCVCHVILAAEYGSVLAELTASGGVGVAYRQLASVLLRQYLDCHWSRQSDKFTEPVPSEQVYTGDDIAVYVWCMCCVPGEDRDQTSFTLLYWRQREETESYHSEPCLHMLI